jgi:hypothetical protein
LDYEKILKRAWEITKTYKVLWIFGMALAVFSGGSFNFSGGGGDSGGLDLPETPPMEKLPQETSQVLGAYTDSIVEVFTNIPIGIWIVLAVSILLALFSVIALAFFIRNWAKGALIASIHDTQDQKPITLRTGSLHGLAVVKRFIILRIIPWMLLFGMISVLLILTVIVALNLSGTIRTVSLLLLILINLLIGLIGVVVTTLTVILAEQLVVRQNLTSRQALKKGFQLTKKYLGNMIGMGAINLGIGCAFGCATIIVILLLVAIIIFAFAIKKEVGYVAAVIAGIPILAFILLSILIRGIYMVFNTSTWTLLAREIETKEKGAQDA